jgi:hypothetical protein
VPEPPFSACYDPAKLRDFAVATVRIDDQVVWMERWKEMAYTIQTQKVAALARRYNNALVYIDEGGPGQPLKELLQEEHLNVTGVTFTNELKETMINSLSAKLEKAEIKIPAARFGPPYSDLIDELTAFERRRTGSGLHYSYAVPDGGYDDCVSALLLTDHGRDAQKRWEVWNW